MKRIFLLLFACSMFLGMHVFAQTVKYTLHTLAQGESLSMLAEKYKTTVGDIMRLNGMHADSKLVPGKKLKIPASGQTVKRGVEAKPIPSVTVNKVAPPVNKTSSTITQKISPDNPATHIIQHGETLYSISTKYGLSIDELKQLNNLQDNSLKIGEELALNSKAVEMLAAKKVAQQNAAAIQSIPDSTPPLILKPVVKENPKPVDTGTVQTENKEPDIIANNTNEEATQKINTINVSKDGNDSYFSAAWSETANGKSVKSANGNAMIFKTASGWNDKKFYVLMNEAPSGSIVKVTAANGNSVFAKVLWSLDDMKINQGLKFRISEAAAAALNVTENKFLLTIEYHQ